MDRAVRLGDLFRREAWLIAGALASVVAAVVLFTRYSLHASLTRDEGIYVYGGQQLAHGVPPYASIFDPKTPLATMISGAAAFLAHQTGRDDLSAVRMAFFVCAVLAVLATYLLAARLFRSVPAGLTAAVVLASFSSFATDALGGPNAKTPGVLLLVLSMWLTARRNWFWAGVAGGLAFLVWQPLIGYPFVTVLVALLAPGGTSRLWATVRALGGAALPVLAVTAYFWLAGALGDFLESALVFPFTGVHRGAPDELLAVVIAKVAHRYMGWGAIVFGLGLVLLVTAVVVHLVRHRRELRRGLADPLVAVVFTTFLIQFGYANTDFQSYPDLYPLLPYAGLGLGALVAAVVAWARRTWGTVGVRAATGVVLAALLALSGSAAAAFAVDPLNEHHLGEQRAAACGFRRELTPGTRLWSLGNPVPLVLTHRRNPDRFIYLGSGVAQWKIDHQSGGFAGWQAQILAVDPSVIVVSGWSGEVSRGMVDWLRKEGYRQRFVGRWRTFVTPEVRKHAERRGVLITGRATERVLLPGGHPMPRYTC